MAQMNFGGVIENVMTREEFPLEKAREVLKDEIIAVIGYGVQGPGQSLKTSLSDSVRVRPTKRLWLTDGYREKLCSALKKLAKKPL